MYYEKVGARATGRRRGYNSVDVKPVVGLHWCCFRPVDYGYNTRRLYRCVALE